MACCDQTDMGLEERRLSLSGMAPAYLAADCQLVSDEGRRQLLSANSRMCVVRWTYSSYADRCFAGVGPKLEQSSSSSETN